MSLTMDMSELSEEDTGNLQYLALHHIPETLERLTKALLQEKPDQPLAFMVRKLDELRLASSAKGIEEYIQHQTNNPQFKLAKAESARLAAAKHHDGEESTRSESSTFSANSADMAEFLQEIRHAFQQLTQGKPQTGQITQAEVGEIIDFVALPIPERMLSDMFTEIDVEGAGSVEFDVFLARINYHIQGRFGTETLKSIFRLVAMDDNVLGLQDIPTVFRKLGFQLSAKEVGELCARCRCSGVVHLEDFQRMVHIHTSSLQSHPRVPPDPDDD